jgi:hypothetical protein
MNIDTQLWDLIKLALSLGGALMLAWLTVGWALKRFQREKTWERRFNAYVDAITAMSEMRAVIGDRIDDIEFDRDPTDEMKKERTERYRMASRQLDKVIAVSGLLLKSDATRNVTTLNTRVSQAGTGQQDFYELLNCQYGVLDDAIHDIGQDAAHDLGIPVSVKHQRSVAKPIT